MLNLNNHDPGKVLVRFHGDHSNSWVRASDIVDDCVELGPGADEDDDPRVANLKAWGRANNKYAALGNVCNLFRDDAQ